MKVGKPKSKRVSVRLRHKIEKASSAKQRKQRKEAKKNPEWRTRLKKDPGIPNLFPYKAKILAEIEESKRRKEEERIQKQENAKARREGRSSKDIVSAQQTIQSDEISDEESNDEDSDMQSNDDEDEDQDMIDEKNPMAALLASAQARANTFDHDIDAVMDKAENDRRNMKNRLKTVQEGDVARVVEQHSKKTLPIQAREDPVKAISLLLARLEAATAGLENIMQYYALPPLFTAGSDTSTRLLVEVARKTGRLGKGGIPNLHAAALLILNDINDERLQLPVPDSKQNAGDIRTGQATIVKTMAAPFRLEGLYGSPDQSEKENAEMIIDE